MKNIFGVLLVGILFIVNMWGDGIVVKDVQEVDGADMPGWESQVIERFGGKPVVFRGGAKDWEAMEWTLENLSERVGHMEVHVGPKRVLEDGFTDDGQLNDVAWYRTLLREHIDSVVKGPAASSYLVAGYDNRTLPPEGVGVGECYYEKYISPEYGEVTVPNENEEINWVIPQMLDIEGATNYPHMERSVGYNFFIGPDSTLASLHNHYAVFLAQIVGEKVVSLIAPEDRGRCYCVENEEEQAAYRCKVDVMDPDYVEYPKIEGMEVYRVVIEPGDVLYIPHKWLHDVRPVKGSPSVSVACGFEE